jgi:hypothetical protein
MTTSVNANANAAAAAAATDRSTPGDMCRIELPLLLVCKYCIDNYMVRAWLCDDLHHGIQLDHLNPPCIAGMRFATLEDFSEHVLQKSKSSALSHWYIARETLSRFDKWRKVNSLMPSVRSMDMVASIDYRMPPPASALPIQCQLVLIDKPTLQAQYDAWQAYLPDSTDPDETTARQACMFPSHVLMSRKATGETLATLATLRMPLDTVDSIDKVDKVDKTMLHDHAYDTSDKSACISLLFDSMMWMVRAHFPSSELHSALVIDRYTSKYKPVPLVTALQSRHADTITCVDTVMTEEPWVFGGNSASQNVEHNSVLHNLHDWVLLNVVENGEIKFCDDIVLRFALPPTMSLADVKYQHAQIDALMVTLTQHVRMLISSVTVMDFLYISLFPFQIDQLPMAVAGAAVGAGLKQQTWAIKLPQFQTTIPCDALLQVFHAKQTRDVHI